MSWLIIEKESKTKKQPTSSIQHPASDKKHTQHLAKKHLAKKTKMHPTPSTQHPASDKTHTHHPTSSNKQKSMKQKITALLLTFTVLLPSISPYGNVLANNNGPNAPEAASFEPVDATDMVNLLTGDFTYVLPLMNVPSPEGGYPIALAYHAGIAMDQEASWVGLGWNLNPGAINRSVNGYPDDYNHAPLSEYFYDEGEKETHYNLSITYSAGASVGVGLSWGSNKSLGGHVSIGYGIALGNGSIGASTTIGTEGASVGIGYTSSSGLSFGISANSEGQVGYNVSFAGLNGSGFGISGNSDGTFSAGAKAYGLSLGTSISSAGIGISVSTPFSSYSIDADGSLSYSFNVGPLSVGGNNKGGASVGVGIGSYSGFSSTIQQGDYTSNQSGFTIPLVIPTPIGIFSLSFGKQEIDYWAARKTTTLVTGPIDYLEINSKIYYVLRCNTNDGRYNGFGDESYSRGILLADRIGGNPFKTYSLEEAENKRNEVNGCRQQVEFEEICTSCVVESVVDEESYMDTYEIPLSENSKFGEEFNINDNNPVFPAYDKYNVQAQGLSGSIHAKLTDNGRLVGLSRSFENIDIKYAFDGLSGNLPEHLKFSNKPQFYFDNEISTFLGVAKANFISPSNAITKETIKDAYIAGSANYNEVNHLKKSNHIEYYTNQEILQSETPKNEGLLLPVATGFDRQNKPTDGIGAYKITTPDGKTYHYSLPVYNYATVTRIWGWSPFHKGQGPDKAYQEKRQLTPYATHWLLTAITGPDFVDDGDGIANERDLGYWVNFEYGLWDDTYVWRTPYGKEYHVSEDDPDIKSWTKGIKQQYFLDKIQTRTHTALFVKSEREDNRSPEWEYRSVNHDHGEKQYASTYNSDNGNRFTIPEHKTLKLDKIILVGPDGLQYRKNRSTGYEGKVDVIFPQSNVGSRDAKYGNWGNVLDNHDDEVVELALSRAIKVVDLNYRNHSGALVQGTPNAGDTNKSRLTLGSVNFKGKQGADVMPPYVFDYFGHYGNNPRFGYNDKFINEYGYNYLNPAAWSLNEIRTPQGGKIQVEYESHNFKSVNTHKITLRNKDVNVGIRDVNGRITFKAKSIFNLKQNDRVQLNLSRSYGIYLYESVDVNFNSDIFKYDYDNYKGEAIIEKITKLSEENEYELIIKPISNIKTDEKTIKSFYLSSSEPYEEGGLVEIEFNTSNNNNVFYGNGGPRVKSIKTKEGIKTIHTSRYKYGEKENGIGWVPYIPFAPEVDKEAPYSFELPAPVPMYEYVKHESLDANDDLTGSTLYHFKVIKNKSNTSINYDGMYKINVNKEESVWSESKRRYVSVNEYEIEDNLNCLGQLLSVSNFNRKGQLLNKVENSYFTPGEIPNNLGTTQESYQSYKTASYSTPDNKTHWYINSSTRIKYPNLLKSSTEIKNGVSYTTRFNNFDPISGQAKETHSFSSNGLEIKSVSEPAFRKYPEMGSKADNPTNKNMLSQAASTYSYFKKSSADPWKLLGAEIETWKNWENNIWRKHRTYAWKGPLNEDGSYQFNAATHAFDWEKEKNGEAQHTSWQKLSEITRYSDYSRPLETEDINGNKASNKMGDNYSKVWAVCNAPYDAMFYANFENQEDFEIPNNDVSGGFATVDAEFISDKVHTGSKALKLKSAGNALYLRPKIAGNYKASVWAHKSNYQNIKLDLLGENASVSFNPNELVEAGDWVQLNFYVTLTQEGFVVLKSTSGDAYIDDFRMHPIESNMTSYVYNEWDELTYILGSNNLGTKFEYNAAGQLIKTSTEVSKNGTTEGGFKLVSKSKLSYKGVSAPEN